MLADRFLQKRYAAGFVEGFAEGLAEVRAERQGEGQVDLKRDREVWKELRKEAEAKARRPMRYRLPLREESGSPWLSDRFLQKRYAAGQAEMQKEWEAWNERRQEAEAKGQAFDELPPTLEKQR